MPSSDFAERRVTQLWLTWLLPVGAWGVHLMISYSLVEWYCQHPWAFSPNRLRIALVLLLAFAMAIVFWGFLLARRNYKSITRSSSSKSSGRALFMVQVGSLLGILAVVLILVESVPLWILPLCAV